MKTLSPRHALIAFVLERGTQRQAADVLGISQQYLSDLLSGRRTFSAAMLKKLGLKTVIVKLNGAKL